MNGALFQGYSSAEGVVVLGAAEDVESAVAVAFLVGECIAMNDVLAQQKSNAFYAFCLGGVGKERAVFCLRDMQEPFAAGQHVVCPASNSML